MKNLFKGVAVVAVLFLSAGIANGQQKIGHVNSGELIQAMAEFKTANATLEELAKTKQTELQNMYTEYTSLQTKAQEAYRNRSEANKDSVDVQLQSMQMELQEIENRINEVQELAQQEIETKREELFAPVFQKANTAIQNVGKEKGYAYVFDISSTNIPYFQGGDDLTADVKAKLGL